MIILRIVEILKYVVTKVEFISTSIRQKEMFLQIFEQAFSDKTYSPKKKREENFRPHTLGILQDVTVASCVCLVIERNILNTHNVAT